MDCGICDALDSCLLQVWCGASALSDVLIALCMTYYVGPPFPPFVEPALIFILTSAIQMRHRLPPDPCTAVKIDSGDCRDRNADWYDRRSLVCSTSRRSIPFSVGGVDGSHPVFRLPRPQLLYHRDCAPCGALCQQHHGRFELAYSDSGRSRNRSNYH